MPPVDIYRVYYMAPRDAQPGTEYAAMLSAIIEQAAARASNPGAVDRKTTDIIIRDTAQKKHPKGCNCGCAVCKYEAARDRGQGRGHKGSLARFQDESEDKQPPRLLTRDTGVQCDDTETSPLLSL
ncbi:hypothetical protein LPJ63_003925 [Coemansia sp. RSA 2711]|nr:hypothetical protein LPJ63_003925 [Coemansia sp. RSA 2711]